MSEFELKPIHHASVERSLAKARQYRLLNEPLQAESICLDIVQAEPDNEAARIELILAMSDQFAGHRKSPHKPDLKAHVAALRDEYSRCYYTGLVCEREGLAYLERGHAAVFAYGCLRDAMDWYEKAEALQPEGNEDAVLRYNSCVRTIRREKLKPPADYGSNFPLE
ncbi:MAG: hypothetical protein KDK70_03335 [Myxococcales bacterium]|nr:hypothetical protein [Myxococcales bacterium]